MRSKSRCTVAASRAGEAIETGRVQADLEQRGVAPEISAIFAARFARRSQGLSQEAYEAALDAVALAWATPAEAGGASTGLPNLDELQRLMTGFAGELHKLEEALRILDAYVSRMRTQTRPREASLH